MRDDTEYGVEYVVVVPGEKPRLVTVWNGFDRAFSESAVHEMRRDIERSDGVRYVRACLITRINPAMSDIHQMRQEEWETATPFGRAWLAERRMGNPYNIPTECLGPRTFHRATRTERYAASIEFDTWSIYGTAEGDAFLAAWMEKQLALRDLTPQAPPSTPKQLSLA